VIRIEGTHFKDEHGRTLMLRGVNLGGSSKVPAQPDGATHLRQGFFDHRHVSFIGRPFPLGEADEHFGRLAAWGLTFVRLLVTWEAVEHAGPGIYDDAYLDYLRAIAERAAHHGISLLIDPHQDVWSRFSGGDGAPGWTLEAAGFDLPSFAETGAAIVHATHGDPFPRMIWPTNGARLAAATMFTLFFGGDDFAPETRIDGEPPQALLQHHFLSAMQQVARRLRGLPNIAGYDMFNEPLPGFIGWQDLNLVGGSLTLGACPTPFEAMRLGAGMAQEVGLWQLGPLGARRARTIRLNASGRRAWREGRDCVWRQNGVWDVDGAGDARLLRESHFAVVRGRPVDFRRDYLAPFARRFASAIRAADPAAAIFLEREPDGHAPPWDGPDLAGIAYAPHWYDGHVLMMKRFSPFLAADARSRKPVFLPRPIRRSFASQLGDLAQAGKRAGMPVLLGEFGIPFDLDEGRAYRTGDFRHQVASLDRTFRAVEANLLSGTLWNYTSDNTNARGDGWNGEDLSIFSRDQQDEPGDIDSGGRGLPAVVRPYPRAVAGQPLRLAFDLRSRMFEFSFRDDPAVTAATEIFLPRLHYGAGCRVEVSDGTAEVDREGQLVIYRHAAPDRVHWVRISPG